VLRLNESLNGQATDREKTIDGISLQTIDERIPLRPKIHRVLKKSWIVCIILYVVFLVLRGIGCLGPESIRLLILVSFVLMWPLPFIFYTKIGWKGLGLRKIEKPLWIIYGILLGAGSAIIVYLVGFGLFGNTNDHWFISLLNQVISEEDRAMINPTALFLIVTIPSIIFSPIGEEFLFRGLIHESFKFQEKKWLGYLANSLAFATIHIFHYGITYDAINGLEIQFLNGFVWFSLMMGVSIIFTLCKEKSNSIAPAILSHASFNLVMNVTTFLFII